MNKDIITDELLLLPGDIAAESTAIMNLLIEKMPTDQKIDEIKTAVELQINTDKAAYPNDGARKAGIKDLLAQNTSYGELIKKRDAIKNTLDLTIIAHQRKRDMMNCLIAIAGMK